MTPNGMLSAVFRSSPKIRPRGSRRQEVLLSSIGLSALLFALSSFGAEHGGAPGGGAPRGGAAGLAAAASLPALRYPHPGLP